MARNIRELQNVVERAVILCEGDGIPPALLHLHVTSPRSRGRRGRCERWSERPSSRRWPPAMATGARRACSSGSAFVRLHTCLREYGIFVERDAEE